MDSLNDKQRAEIRCALEELKLSLEKAIDEASENTKPVDLDNPIGRVTRIDAIQQQSMAKANREANRRRLSGVKAALKRIDEADYGLCQSCGELIPFARLLAKPESQLCVDCQEDRERG